MQVEGQRAEASATVAATGEWVSNTYPTCPLLGDSLSKERLIPDGLTERHLSVSKDSSAVDGDASD